MSKPIAKLRTSRPVLLYEDRLVEPRTLVKREAVYPLVGVMATVTAGMGMRAITLGNVGYLSIVGPGVAITRELRGRAKIRAGTRFAAEVNAASKASRALT